MNYPELIWRLIELVLQKEKDYNQENDSSKKTTNWMLIYMMRPCRSIDWYSTTT